MKALLVGLVTILAVGVGCTAFPNQQTVAEAVLLRVELDRAVDSLLGLPLTDSERALAEAAVADFTAVAKQLDRRGVDYERLQMLVDRPSAVGRNLLDDMVGAYLMAHLVYTSYIERTGTAPDPLLVRYDESARDVYAELDQLMRAGSGAVDLRGLQGYLALTLRAVSAFALS